MTTDISPVFGLTLLQLAELIAIFAAGASIAVAVAIFKSTRTNERLAGQSRDQLERHARQTEEHAERAHKLASANLVLRLLEYWDETKYKDFSDMVGDMVRGDVEENDPRLDNYLGMWEEIAIFYHDGVLTENQAFEFFVADLQAMRNNDAAYKYLNAQSKKGTYLNLWGMVHDITNDPNI